MGSIQGKVMLYVTSENGGQGGLDLPTVTSELVSVDQFPQYMADKMANGGKGLRDQYLVSQTNNTQLTYMYMCNTQH